MNKNKKRINKTDINLMVAKSLAVGTRDRSAKRIIAAAECCIRALRSDGFYVETDQICVSKIQDKIDEELKTQ